MKLGVWCPHNSVTSVLNLETEVNIVVVGWEQGAEPTNLVENTALYKHTGRDEARSFALYLQQVLCARACQFAFAIQIKRYGVEDVPG